MKTVAQIRAIADAVANDKVTRNVYKYAYIDGAITATILAIIIGAFVCG